MAPSDTKAFFARVVANNSATLYERPAEDGIPGWIACVVFAAGAPATLTLSDAWTTYAGNPRNQQNGACFVVSAVRPDDPLGYLQGFIAAIQSLNAQSTFAYRYLFWGDPTTSDPSALAGTVAFTNAGNPSGPAPIIGEPMVKARNVGLQFLNAQFGPVGEDSLAFTQAGFPAYALISNKYVSQQITTVDPTINLPLAGAAAGTLQFGVTLRNDRVEDDFALLDVGIKYFTRRAGRVLSQRYPILGAPIDGNPMPFDAQFDCLRPLDHARTWFRFRGAGGVCQVMASALRDPYGHPLQILPQAGVSRLVCQQDRVTLQDGDGQQDFYYFVPAGAYQTQPNGAPPAASRIMCGLSPLEFASFGTDPPVITFHPNQPAYSPLLEDDGGGTGAPRLSDDFLTAWSTLTAKAPTPPPVYFAQPEGAPMYVARTDDAPFLDHHETPAAELTDASDKAAFPLVGYGALTYGAHPDMFTPADVARLERDALSVARRSRIAASGSPPRLRALGPMDGPVTVTTPQGFLVDLDGSGKWERLHLGQTVWSASAGSPAVTDALAFRNVDDVLRGAFQTNQQFLVITAPRVAWTPPQGTGFDHLLNPQGWPFQIDVGSGNNPGDYRNVLIFKFCDGALEDRIDNPSRWTNSADFNADPDDVAQWIRDYIETAKQYAAGPDAAYFKRFIEVVTTPGWRGILMLRVDVDASALPEELRGLVAGIDLTRFNAHHVGINLSFVEAQKSSLSAQGNSALFATVYYIDPGYAAGLTSGASPDLPIPAPQNVDYAFKVLTLKVLFDNAEIVAFASKSQVTLNRIFGDPATALTLNGVPAISTSLVLNGTYENHGGKGVYVFATGADARFTVTGNVWRGIEIVKATFSTLKTAPGGGEVRSRFAFRGFLDFAALPLDVLSFGGTATGRDASATGLGFSELHLDMAFDSAAPNKPSFGFRIDQMTFSPANNTSCRRDASLYARMPLTLTGIIAGTSKPQDQGFLPVSTIGLATYELGPAWYGLVFDVAMGTPGALAGTLGFTSRLLVAWGPNSQGDAYRVALGFALPGAGSGTASSLSLQGVLKLTVGQILLYAAGDNPQTFALRLNNVLLSLLGFSFPPGTSTAFIVFGNPSGERDAVGWYASVNREEKKQTRIGGES